MLAARLPQAAAQAIAQVIAGVLKRIDKKHSITNMLAACAGGQLTCPVGCALEEAGAWGCPSREGGLATRGLTVGAGQLLS